MISRDQKIICILAQIIGRPCAEEYSRKQQAQLEKTRTLHEVRSKIQQRYWKLNKARGHRLPGYRLTEVGVFGMEAQEMRGKIPKAKLMRVKFPRQ